MQTALNQPTQSTRLQDVIIRLQNANALPIEATPLLEQMMHAVTIASIHDDYDITIHLADKGKALVTVRGETLRLGKWATRLASRLQPQTPEWAVKAVTEAVTALLRTDAEDTARLEFIRDADGIREAYSEPLQNCLGSTSCMTGSYSVRAYASPKSPELALAVLRDKDGNVIARTLVDTEAKTYLRIYGDTPKMQAALAAAGYKRDEAMLLGKYLLAECPDTGRELAPYLDGDYNLAERLRIDGKAYWLVTYDEQAATHELNRTDGYANEHTPSDYCPCCDCYRDADDMRTVYAVRTGQAQELHICTYCNDSVLVYDHEHEEHVYFSPEESDETYLEVVGHESHEWLPTAANYERLAWVESQYCYAPTELTVECALEGDTILVEDAVIISLPDADDILYAHNGRVELWRGSRAPNDPAAEAANRAGAHWDANRALEDYLAAARADGAYNDVAHNAILERLYNVAMQTADGGPLSPKSFTGARLRALAMPAISQCPAIAELIAKLDALGYDYGDKLAACIAEEARGIYGKIRSRCSPLPLQDLYVASVRSVGSIRIGNALLRIANAARDTYIALCNEQTAILREQGTTGVYFPSGDVASYAAYDRYADTLSDLYDMDKDDYIALADWYHSDLTNDRSPLAALEAGHTLPAHIARHARQLPLPLPA